MVQRTDAEAKRDKLQTWLTSKLPSAQSLSISPLVKAKSGYGSEIHFFDLHWREAGREHIEKLLIREEPMVLRVFPVYDMGKEFHTMRCLQGSAVPVPKMYWLELDNKVLGAPFFVMGKVEGEVIDPQQFGEEPHGPLYEATPEGRGKIWRQAIEVMAKINTVDWERLGLSFFGVKKKGTGALDHQIAFYERMAEWAGVRPQPFLDSAFAWFKKNIFEPKHVSLCWGDARLGNIMYHNGEVTAAIDWDMTHIGAAEDDLAWLLAVDWLNSESGLRGPRWEGIPERDEIIQLYESATGRKLENFSYHEAFALLKLGIIFWRVIKTMPGVPADFAPDNPPLKKLGNMLGIDYNL
jgi:aminoglycoside phosphotransferase (APT) family kinase protein